MPDRADTSYFGAGPAPLPTKVLEEASKVLLSYKDSGIGIAEISHRSADANAILAQAKDALATLYEIPDSYEILFLQSGGTGEFSAAVYNLVGVWVEKARAKFEGAGKSVEADFAEFQELVRRELRLDYLVTGSWSKASQEAARLVGKEYVNVAVDAQKANGGKFGVIPDEASWSLTTGALPALTYFCDNETVDGVEFPAFPKSLEAASEQDDRVVVADMSSNFISRRVDVQKYSVIFGGAQKNVGSTGITIVIVRKSLLAAQAAPELLRKLGLPVGPIVLDWPTIAKNNSLYNTLPIFDVWIAGRVMADLVQLYGDKRIAGQQEVSDKKAKLIYDTLTAHSGTYGVVPDKAVWSRMNICLRVKGGDADAEKAFLAGAEKKGLYGLKGHRSVGGIRISNYNAVSLASTEKLVAYLNDFAATV